VAGGVAGLLLPDAGAEVVPPTLAFFAGGLGLLVAQGSPDDSAFLPPVALPVAVAVAVGLAVPVALPLAVAVGLVLAEAVPDGDVLSLPPGLALVLLLSGLRLELSLAGLVCEPAGGTLGGCVLLDLADPAALGEAEGDGHPGVLTPLGLADGAPPWAAARPGELAALPDPSRLGAFPLGLEEESPTADPSWTKASRSGGSARTTPMANTAQAAARAGLSSPSRQSRGR
jgi:hypothetical protein